MIYHDIDQERFDALMTGFGPFEHSPHVAVGVSGGADSMALAILLSDWAERQGGSATALIVDHGLRPESGTEALGVSRVLAALGIKNKVLCWASDNVTSALQSKARHARYALMQTWCKEANVLHLAVAHHADDQAETVLMRMEKGSGSDGLSGIPQTRELEHCRLLRPLLNVRKQALIRFLADRDLPWVHDPSNDNPKFARTAIRTGIVNNNVDIDGVVASATRFTRVRDVAETAAARWLARYADLKPTGYLSLNRLALMDAAEDTRLRVLSRAATVIGGKTYPPAISATERLFGHLADGRAATVSGSLFTVKKDTVVVFREMRNLPTVESFIGPETIWDGRFSIATHRENPNFKVMAFGQLDPLTYRDLELPNWLSDLPSMAQRTIPVICSRNEIFMPEPNGGQKHGVSLRFLPKIPLVGMGFSVA
jgi:tRNA(Ile)-lysidine synthase